MAKPLRKKLPKDFEALLENDNFAKLTKALEGCALDARGSLGNRTALHYKCSAKLTRWLVERGADLEAEDTWGNAPLHNRITYQGDIDVLLELGADIEHQSRSLGMPLHNAADGRRIKAATKLLDRGAKVDALNREGRTPLELALARCSNASLPQMVEMAKLLLDRGAKIGPGCKKSVTRIGEEFEFHRAGFAKSDVSASSKALETLYEMFDVEPVPRRVVHDRKTRIEVKATEWKGQHEELWNLLVPSSGAAATVQGEVVRIAGRIGDEMRRNGGCNWDAAYRAMAKAFQKHVATGKPLSSADQEIVAAVMRSLPDDDDDVYELARLGVKWVLANPDPVKLAKPSYRR